MFDYARPDGLILTSDLRRLELDDRAVRKAASSGALVRLNRGAFMERATWSELQPEGRYRARVRAAILCSPTHPVASHLSAAVLWGMPLLATRPALVHVLASRASGTRREGAFHRHAAESEDVEIVELDGIRVTSFHRTLVDVAREEPFAAAVTCLDWALSGRSTGPTLTKELLSGLADSIGFIRGRRRVDSAIDFADGRSGSPGESWSRVVIHQLGFPAPELQIAFEDRHGLIGIVDFWWRIRRLIGEFDGRRKYVGDRFGSTMSVEEIVYAEKRREDRLRAGQNSVSRWGWEALASPHQLHDLLIDAGLKTEKLRGRVQIRAGSANSGRNASPRWPNRPGSRPDSVEACQGAASTGESVRDGHQGAAREPGVCGRD